MHRGPELPPKTQSADAEFQEDSWGHSSWQCVAAPSGPAPPAKSAPAPRPPRARPHLPAAGSVARAAGAGWGLAGPAGRDHSRAQPRSALPAAAPRLPSAHPRPLRGPGYFSRRWRPALFGVGLSSTQSARRRSQGSCARALGSQRGGGGGMTGSRASLGLPPPPPCAPVGPRWGMEGTRTVLGALGRVGVQGLGTRPSDHEESPLAPPTHTRKTLIPGGPFERPVGRQLSVFWVQGEPTSPPGEILLEKKGVSTEPTCPALA